MSLQVTYKFDPHRNFEVFVDFDTSSVETRFLGPFPKTVHSLPFEMEKYDVKSVELGYGKGAEARADFLREHEILHTMLSLRLGHRWSNTLWAVANNRGARQQPDPNDPNFWPLDAQYREEEIVMKFQAYLNGQKPTGLLQFIFHDLESLKNHALVYLREGPQELRQSGIETAEYSLEDWWISF
jgi:hypothetical protein